MFGDLENFNARFTDFVVFGALGALQFVFVVFVVSTVVPLLGIPVGGGFTTLTAGLIAAATILNGGMPKDT